MTTAVFVDSTTLLYTQDRRDPAKQVRSSQWLKSLVATRRMALNLQVLNETYAVVSRKPAFAHWQPEVREFCRDLLTLTTTRGLLTADLVEAAWRIEDRYMTGYWDALLLASANAGGCSHFLSEDLNDGQVYGAVTVIDPFRHTPEDVLGASARS